jgi:hypothetical protein
MSGRISPLEMGGLSILALLVVCLVAIVVYEFDRQDDDDMGEVKWTPNSVNDPRPLPNHKPIDMYREILAHPVFFMSREPFVAPAPVPVVPQQSANPPPPADPGWTLAGVWIDHGFKKAYLFHKGEQGGSWVAEGGSLAGWTVGLIDADMVLLQQRDRTIKLRLYPD